MARIEDLIESSFVKVGAKADEKKSLIQVANYALSVAEKLAPSGKDFRPQSTDLPQKSSIGMALSGSIQSVSALLSAASVKCNRAIPPADIEMKVTGEGRLIYRCYHLPPHEWDLSGVPIDD